MSTVRKKTVKYKRCSFFVSGPGTALLTNERMVHGRKGPGYLERKFQGMIERSRERMDLKDLGAAAEAAKAEP